MRTPSTDIGNTSSKSTIPVAGKAEYPGAPFGMSATPWSVESPAPTLGQHNVEVYVDELGISQKELGQLVAAGVV